MPHRRRLPARLLGATLAFALASWSPLLSAQREGERPGPLLGGTPGTPKPPPTLDARLPLGPRRHEEPRPNAAMTVACGLRRNVCVHAGTEVSPALHQAYVDALEGAWDQVVGALRLPAPLPDPGLGPTPGLDLYLLSQATEALVARADPRRQLADVSSGFCMARPSEEQRQRQAALCVAEASLLGLDAAETPHVRRAIASELWLALGSPTGLDLAVLDDAQSNPQLGLVKREQSGESSGAALWFRALNRRLAAGRPGRLPPALVQQSRGSTPAGASEWHNEPDVLDVTRVAFESRRESFADFALDFAIERAFLGSRDAGDGDPALRWLGDAGRVRFDWVIPASSLPRRVAPRRPLEPLGAAYLWLAIDRVTLGATLAFRAEWEGPVTFRWSLVAVDGAGKMLKRFDLPLVQNATSAERTLVDYDGAAGLLIVGTNLGGVDLAHPFDPDFEPYEPHGFTVYLTEL